MVERGTRRKSGLSHPEGTGGVVTSRLGGRPCSGVCLGEAASLALDLRCVPRRWRRCGQVKVQLADYVCLRAHRQASREWGL